MELGIDQLCHRPELRKPLQNKRVAFLGHPASVTQRLTHSLDELIGLKDLKITAAFAPQHGMKGEKQDNMMESQDYLDPIYRIPVFSLYGEVRRPSRKMMDTFDVILIDLQDLGCRIYTFITTLLYMMEECSKFKKSVWILDRPNPIGRPIEGSLLEPGWESFVGAGPIPMRHGMTVGEMARWYQKHFKLDLELRVIEMKDYRLSKAPGYGWPVGELAWVNPSPNAPNLSMARCYPGSVLLEGTHLSEGRGTTRPLEEVGAPDLDFARILKRMNALAPDWLKGCQPRICYFEPTFHKHAHQLCQGIQFHTESPFYQHEAFQPYRCFSLVFKAMRMEYPDYPIWRSFHYEYVKDKLAIDVINGGQKLRNWVDDPTQTPQDFEKILQPDEAHWGEERRSSLIYSD